MLLRRTLWLLVAGLILSPMAGVSGLHAANTNNNNNQNKGAPKVAAKDLPPQVLVVKFEGAERGRYFGADVMIMRGMNMLEGKPMQVPIPNVTGEENKNNAYKPKPDLLTIVTAAKPGDYIKVEAEKKDPNQLWAKKLTVYKAAQDEELPGVFVFQESYSKQIEDNGPEYQVITLVKWAQFVDAVVPSKKGSDGKMVADETIMKLAGTLKKGDAIEAELAPGQGQFALLTALDPHKAPVAAKLEKLGDVQIDGVKYPAAELSVDGSTQTIPLVGRMMGKKLVADGRLLAKVKSIRPGSEVTIRTRDDAGKTWLRDIQWTPAAKGSDSKPRFDTPKGEAKPDTAKPDTTAKPAAKGK